MDPSQVDDPREECEAGEGLWAWFALPWVVSSTVHAALLLVVALLWTPPSAPHAAANPIFRVHAEFIEPDGSSEEAGPEGLNFSANPAGAKYFNDDPGAPSEQQDIASEQPQETAQEPNGPASASEAAAGMSVENVLAAVTSERPPVSFSALLPRAGGAGGRTEDSVIANARGLTSGTAPSTRLGRSGYASTSVFGAGGQGYKFVYVFDRSGSMGFHGGAPLKAAKAQLIKSLGDLGQTHQFQILFYNDHPAVFNPTGVPGRLVFGTDANKSAAEQFVRSIVADGATEHEEALHLALRLAPDVIFFLTDADEPRLNSDQLAKVQSLNRGTCINCIEFGYGAQGDADNFLVKLARQNYGTHVYVDVSRLKAGN